MRRADGRAQVSREVQERDSFIPELDKNRSRTRSLQGLEQILEILVIFFFRDTLFLNPVGGLGELRLIYRLDALLGGSGVLRGFRVGTRVVVDRWSKVPALLRRPCSRRAALRPRLAILLPHGDFRRVDAFSGICFQ